jgi:hypothetical protein
MEDDADVVRVKATKLVTDQPALSAFFTIYYVALLIYGFIQGNEQTPFYALFLAIAAFVVARLHARHGLSGFVLWGLCAWGFMHMMGGLIEFGSEVIYEHSLGPDQLRFDKFVHFFGFGFATLASYELLRVTFGRDEPARSVAIVAFLIGIGIGGINETIEFGITLLPGESNVGGFSNTGWDLVANALGAATAAMGGALRDGTSTRDRARRSLPG